MQRTKIVAGNWKMNLNLQEGAHLVEDIIRDIPGDLTCEVVIAPPFTHIHMLDSKIAGSQIRSAAQHCHFEPSGAYTGEVSVLMLKSMGVEYIIAGHSERRQLFYEDNEMIKSKVDAILSAGLIPIFCCGESLEIRQSGLQNEFVKSQLEQSVFHVDAVTFSRIIIAYEPIWAIGTGITASPEQAQEMHSFLRQTISTRYGAETSGATRILYGGSIKADNARSLFTQPDVDGGLVGGASLQAAGFVEIIRAACG